MDKLINALRTIGNNEVARNKLVAVLKEIESELQYEGDAREEVVGPIVDAMFDAQTILNKRISNGLVFDYYYRTKIARDFLLSAPEVPDHVWEPQTTKLLMHLSRQAKHVLVGGAYFGDQVVMVANQIQGNEGIIHAFEPNVDQNQMLQKNANNNGLTNIRTWRMGLWKDSDSHLRLVGEDSFAYAELAQTENGTADSDAFPTVSIDHYLHSNQISKLDLIMLDIEGLEYDVLQGAKSQLELPPGDAPNIVFEVHRHYVDWSNGLHNSDIVKFLAGYGYSVFAVRDYNSNVDMHAAPVEIIAPEEVHLEGPPHGFNMLAVKDVTILNHALFKECNGVSPKLLKHKDPRFHHPIHKQ
ncbi:FkbM family methyltransferase [Paenibacillus kobensis]|uniref:FkbM family methyltransferase n=1 Tax=Paenibacillus kobensis TaxID=59841 RepID=UPI000FD88E24|nr:FkbM family methyltransferase [Paenibacillus kobensis]